MSDENKLLCDQVGCRVGCFKPIYEIKIIIRSIRSRVSHISVTPTSCIKSAEWLDVWRAREGVGQSVLQVGTECR